jgi:CBS domain-containing protein
MKIEQLMTRDVQCIGADERLDRAAQLMWETDCGCVPVVDGEGKVLAMLTDRDICMAAWTQGRAPAELLVRSAMSDHVVTCSSSESPARAQQLMQQHQVRRLPVVDEQGGLVGLVSLSDLAAAAQREPASRENGRDSVATTLAAVARPRRQPAGAEPQRSEVSQRAVAHA